MSQKTNRPGVADVEAANEKTPGDGEGFSSATLAQTPEAPPFQVMPPFTADEYAALREDIASNGVLVPITVDQHGTIIDGHHRQQIASELGTPCPRVVQEFTDDEKRHDLAQALNLKRRHLTREQFRELIAAESKRSPDASDREIARRLGCSPSTVSAVRRPVSKLDTPKGTRDDTLSDIEAYFLDEFAAEYPREAAAAAELIERLQGLHNQALARWHRSTNDANVIIEPSTFPGYWHIGMMWADWADENSGASVLIVRPMLTAGVPYMMMSNGVRPGGDWETFDRAPVTKSLFDIGHGGGS
jgi:DNA-binding CsgD family transcriptional regulator